MKQKAERERAAQKKALLQLSKSALIKKCKKYNLPTTGSKSDMVNRILKHENKKASSTKSKPKSKKKTKVKVAAESSDDSTDSSSDSDSDSDSSLSSNANTKSPESTKPSITYQQEYDSILSALIDLFSSEIESDILSEIAHYSVGKIFECNTSFCNNDIFVSPKHDIIGDGNKSKEDKHMGRRGGGEYLQKHYIPNRTYDDIEFGIKYYYDDQQLISYCYECLKYIKLCGVERGCKNVIYDNDDKSDANTFMLCSCSRGLKLCVSWHGDEKCKRCNLAYCDSYDGLKRDFCRERKCDDCETVGCMNCVPMVSHGGIRKCYPPRIINPKYKCSNCK